VSELIGNVIVTVAIAASACYAVWNLGPRGWRERLRVRLARYVPALRLYSLGPSGPTGTASGGCPTCGNCGAPSKKG